jgi:hypothetical protein
MQIGDLRFVSREQAKLLRKKGFMPVDCVVMMKFVGLPEKPVSNRDRANVARSQDWSRVDRKLAEVACR